MKTAIKAMIAAAAVAVAAFAGNTARAALDSFAYQGVILEEDGSVPANRNLTVEFRLYRGPKTEYSMWGHTYNVQLDENGLFNVQLSDSTGTPIPSITNNVPLAKWLAENGQGYSLYVGLTVVGSSGEIKPRQAIIPVPFAIYAADAAKASTNFPVAGKVTAEELDVSGNTTLNTLTVTSDLAVNGGNVTVATSGSFSGYGTIPVGGIIMWSGSEKEIPDGWALCDGQVSNGRTTPNLRGKFIVGYSGSGDYKKVGNTGGLETVTLTTNQIPSHTHDVRVAIWGYSSQRQDSWEVMAPEWYYNNHEHIKTGSAGGGKAHENRPPYYVLCFIMRVK